MINIGEDELIACYVRGFNVRHVQTQLAEFVAFCVEHNIQSDQTIEFVDLLNAADNPRRQLVDLFAYAGSIKYLVISGGYHVMELNYEWFKAYTALLQEAGIEIVILRG